MVVLHVHTRMARPKNVVRFRGFFACRFAAYDVYTRDAVCAQGNWRRVEHMSRVELCQHICLMFDRGRDLSTTNTPTRCGSQGPLVVPTFSQLALVTNL